MTMGRVLLQSTDDSIGQVSTKSTFLTTLYLNIGIFCFLITVFEFNRHIKSIYFKRLTHRFQSTNRVSATPSKYPFSWIYEVSRVSEEEVLRMVGLDAYMMVRYLNVCWRVSMFLTLCGVAFLVPLYATAGGGLSGWARFTMANIPFQPSAYELWAPVIFAYIFSAYYCRLMQKEYINFMQRRVQYLRAVDSDTPTQTYYTIMVERVPAVLRSHQSLTAFFDKLFPLQVHSVEIALDLNELDSLAATRRQVRNRLERAIAYWRATNQRPKVWLSKRFVEQQYCLRYMEAERSIRPVEDHWLARLFGYLIYDEIEHLWFLLDILNDSVTDLQQAYFQTQESGTSETDRNVTEGRLTKEATNVMNFVKGRMKSAQSTNFNFKYISSASSNLSAYMSSKLGFTPQITSTPAEERKSTDRLLEHDFLTPLRLAPEEEFSPPVSLDGVALASSSRLYLTPRSYNSVNSSNQGHFATQDPSATSYQRSLLQASGESSDTGTSSVQNELAFGSTVGPLRASSNSYQSDNRSRSNSSQSLRQEIGKQMTSLRDRIVESGVIKEAKVATSGALRGMMAATRTLELITFGAYYQTSSTAFVTLRSRVAAACAHQMLLSHENYSMTVLSAPNPRDIIWDNVSTPRTQIELRKSIASYTLVIGAIFWSIVVGFITTVSNLESLAQRYHWIKVYQNTFVYEFLNNYLALGLLLVLLALLPLLFDAVARRYEGLKLESEIQNSIMSRMFYYQLANVFVGLGIGSISSSINQILSTPSSILSILGGSLPSFSIYFATLLATKTLTGIPVEMLRSWSLLQVLGVKLCWNKKKLTRRELKMGALADSAAMYGWMYPNILMVLMILFVYSTIAPLVTPFALLYFSLAYLMYKYQLLYVYVNEYQSGGYMWYAVFNRSMVSLLLGVLVLLCYLTIRKTFSTGPMYLLLPLPIFIALFWQRCNNRYKFPSLCLSLESAMDLDRESEARENAGLPSASANFSSTLFRQPALAEGRIRPAVYRKPGARNTLDVFGSSSRPSQLSQRRSVDGDFEVYDEIGVAREAGDDEDKGSSPFERQLHYQSVSSDEVEARSQRSSPRQSSLRSANTDSRKSLTEKLLTDTKSPCHDRSEANSQPDTDDLLNGGSDVCSNAELELEVDEILSAEEHEEQNETATLSSAILSHISPTKVLFK